MQPDHQTTTGPAQAYAVVVGAALVLGGVGGFFYDSSFGTGSELGGDEILGTFITNGPDNLLHLLAGFTGLALAAVAPRPYALIAGAGFTVLALWGFATESAAILDTFLVGGALNTLHLLVGLAGLGAWALGLTSRAGHRPPPPRRRAGGGPDA